MSSLGLNVHVQKVVVCDLKDDTFYALIWMERDGQMMSMDSRPSDALALALRLDCPIFVEDEVLKNSEDGQRDLRKKLQRRTAQMARESERRGPRPLQDVARHCSAFEAFLRLPPSDDSTAESRFSFLQLVGPAVPCTVVPTGSSAIGQACNYI